MGVGNKLILAGLVLFMAASSLPGCAKKVIKDDSVIVQSVQELTEHEVRGEFCRREANWYECY